MFQALESDHVSRFLQSISPSLLAGAAVEVRTQAATLPGRSSSWGRSSAFAMTAGQFAGPCIAVRDNRQIRQSMILSYEFSVEAHCTVASCIGLMYPVLFDRQAATALGANAQVPIVAATDMAFAPAQVVESDLSGVRAKVSGRGRILVNPFIESATGGITVREFGLGVLWKCNAAGSMDVFCALDVKLYESELPFFQPVK